jgi:hypothetical protein
MADEETTTTTAPEGTETEATETPDVGEVLNQVTQENVNQAVMPWIMQQETQNRETAIRGLQEKYPDFKGENVDAVAEDLQRAGAMPDNGLPPDPYLVERFYLAHVAEAAASGNGGAETPAEAGGEGATLETGAGPGAPEETVDPATERWSKVFQNDVPRDAIS